MTPVKEKVKDLSIAQLLEEYFIEVNANREGVVRGLCAAELKNRLKISTLEELKELFPEYFL